jgi:hypothetical protein
VISVHEFNTNHLRAAAATTTTTTTKRDEQCAKRDSSAAEILFLIPVMSWEGSAYTATVVNLAATCSQTMRRSMQECKQKEAS